MCKPRTFSRSFCSGHCLSCRFKVAPSGLESYFRCDPLFEQLALPIVILLGQLDLRLGRANGGERLVIRGSKQQDVLFGVRKKCFLLINHSLVWTWIDLKETFPALSGFWVWAATSVTRPLTVGMIGVV